MASNTAAPLPDAVADDAKAEAARETVRQAESEEARLSAAQQIVQTARTQLGVPYRYGGTSPETGFDCSGFVKWAFAKHGVTLPRTSREQLHAGIPVKKKDIKVGDLLIFSRRVGSRASTHAALYIGDGKFIHSPSSGRTVCIEDLNEDHYVKRYMGARRVILDAEEVKVYARQQERRQEFLASGAMHSVTRGQTLSGIARKYGVTVRAILQANDLTRSSVLQIGQKLHIPGAAGTGAVASAKTQAPPSSRATIVHVVTSGDTVSELARDYKVSQKAILQANGLAPRHTLRVGQELRIPSSSSEAATQVAAAGDTPAKVPASAGTGKRQAPEPAVAEPEKGAACTIYVVKAGDTAWSIARRHGTTPATLLQANDLSEGHVLQIGQQLRVPGTAAAQAELERPRSMQVYSVQRGDTIWSLARKHGVSTRTLLEANGLTGNSVLSLGQKLRIPVASAD